MILNLFCRLLCLTACFIFTDTFEPPVIKPSRLVVEYGSKASANCSTTYSPSGMGWEASQGQVDQVKGVQFIMWTVENLTEWGISPLCFVNWEDRKQTRRKLQVTMYKRPDVISMTSCSMPVVEGENCQLRCDVQNVAPVQYLKLTMYRQKFQQQFTVLSSTFDEFIATPVNKSIDGLVHSSRADYGTRYWCEAELELGAEGPQPPPVFKSQPLSFSVYYMPMFSNETEILEIEDEELILNCSVSANPPAVYIWTGRSLESEVMSPTLGISFPGNYTCIASNPHGKAKKLFVIKPKYHDCTTFWSILGAGLALASVLIVGYIIIIKTSTSRGTANLSKSLSSSEQKEEGQELVSSTKYHSS